MYFIGMCIMYINFQLERVEFEFWGKEHFDTKLVLVDT